MPRKNEPSITGHLLTTIARTVGVTAGMIVNKTTELTEVAVQAAGATIKASKLVPKKPKPAKKSSANRNSTKKTAKKKSAAKKSGTAKT
jgi:hypothetical protein